MQSEGVSIERGILGLGWLYLIARSPQAARKTCPVGSSGAMALTLDLTVVSRLSLSKSTSSTLSSRLGDRPRGVMAEIVIASWMRPVPTANREGERNLEYVWRELMVALLLESALRRANG